jgi:membrane-associated protease RseP (regulator of RpoE activity)
VNRYLVTVAAALALFVVHSPLSAQEDQAADPAKQAPARKKVAFLGVQTSPTPGGQKGVVVTEVLPKTAAAKAGFKRGDAITGFDDKAIANPEDLMQAVRKAGVGKEVTVNVDRGDQKLLIKAKLEEAPRDLFSQLPPSVFPGGPGFRPGAPQLLDMPDRLRQLQERVDELERRIKALEQEKKSGAK